MLAATHMTSTRRPHDRSTGSRSRPGKLLVVAKAPVPGQVKTRLAEGVGDARAAELASAFLVDTWRLAAAVDGVEPTLVLAGEVPEGVLCPTPTVWSQGEGDLGARLERAFRRALESRPWAIAIGTDSPGLPPSLLQHAVTTFGSPGPEDPPRAVLGPTTDGGYYLIGLERCVPGLLAALPFSSPNTFERTLERLVSRGFRVTTLDPWYDVDVPDDLDVVRRDIESGQITAPATARALGYR
jgi:rSAM/selenodomain-associated transferase 1